jgi:hypothetical protein
MTDERYRSRPIHRELVRCLDCQRWWSVGSDGPFSCPCGGSFSMVDMAAHLAALPKPPPDKT